MAIEIRGPQGSQAVVSSASVALFPGVATALVGESGSGKTLVARALAGILPPVARIVGGEIEFAHRRLNVSDPAEWSTLRGREIGFVFQDPVAALDPLMTVDRQFAEVHRLLGVEREESAARSIQLLDELRVPRATSVLRAYPHQLSGGMAQRIGLAIALASEPRVLLADEPTTALDPIAAATTVALLRELCDRRELALLVISHEFAMVEGLADRVAVMCDGVTVESGDLSDVFERPQHPYTSSLLKIDAARRLPAELWAPHDS